MKTQAVRVLSSKDQRHNDQENLQPSIKIPSLNMDVLKKTNLRQELLDDIIKGAYISNSVVNKDAVQNFRVQTPEHKKKTCRKEISQNQDQRGRQILPVKNLKAMKTSHDQKWVTQKRRAHFEGDPAYADGQSNAIESKFDKQLEELKRMNQEINQLKTQQRKEKNNFELFKVRQSKKRGANAVSQSRASRARLLQNSSDDSDDSDIKIDIPEEGLKHTDSKIDIIQQLLKEKCTQGQLINPAMAMQLLNIAQREEDPEAYEPEFVVQQRRKLELKLVEEKERAQTIKERDALFDFDDQIDQLSEVSDRYPIDMFSRKLDEKPTEDQNNDELDVVGEQRGGESIQLNKLKNEIIKDLASPENSRTNLLAKQQRNTLSTSKNSKLNLQGKAGTQTPKRPVMSAYLTTNQRLARQQDQITGLVRQNTLQRISSDLNELNARKQSHERHRKEEPQSLPAEILSQRIFNPNPRIKQSGVHPRPPRAKRQHVQVERERLRQQQEFINNFTEARNFHKMQPTIIKTTELKDSSRDRTKPKDGDFDLVLKLQQQSEVGQQAPNFSARQQSFDSSAVAQIRRKIGAETQAPMFLRAASSYVSQGLRNRMQKITQQEQGLAISHSDLTLMKKQARPPSGTTQQKLSSISDIQIGQIHINRLKKFFCQNLDRQNSALQNNLASYKDLTDPSVIEQTRSRPPPTFPPSVMIPTHQRLKLSQKMFI